MVDWKTGQPNARFWTLKLLHENFGPGDKLVQGRISDPYVYAQAFVMPDGRRKVLLANERNRAFKITIPGAAGATEEYVDQTTGEQPPASAQLSGDEFTLSGFGVAVLRLR